MPSSPAISWKSSPSQYRSFLPKQKKEVVFGRHSFHDVNMKPCLCWHQGKVLQNWMLLEHHLFFKASLCWVTTARAKCTGASVSDIFSKSWRCSSIFFKYALARRQHFLRKISESVALSRKASGEILERGKKRFLRCFPQGFSFSSRTSLPKNVNEKKIISMETGISPLCSRDSLWGPEQCARVLLEQQKFLHTIQ